MSENEKTETTAPARTFVSVNGKALGENDGANGTLTFVSASKLAKEGVTGIVAEGMYEGSKTIETKFGPKLQFAIRQDNGNLILVDAAGNLGSQMSKVEANSYVQISYMGKDVIASGKWKGQEAHKFIVGVAAE